MRTLILRAIAHNHNSAMAAPTVELYHFHATRRDTLRFHLMRRYSA